VRAFVTGASGFIGSRLTARLKQAGWQVGVLLHKSYPDFSPGIESIRGDIRDIAILREGMRGADVVFHLAAALGASRIGAKEFLAINAGGTRAVLEAASAAGVRKILHFSSAGVLGRVKSGTPAGEDSRTNPKDVYDRTKLEGERIALGAAREGLGVVVVRPGWAYGPADRRTFKLFRSIAAGRFILPSKGKTLQTPVYVEDLVDGTLLCSERGRPGEIYHLAGVEALTVKEIVETIASAVDRRIPRLRLPLLPALAVALAMGKSFALFHKEAPLNLSRLSFFIRAKPLSIQKAFRELGYQPAWSFRRGAADAVKWYRDNGWL
jgi:nucleoside-diphosphate-sugar epimerase